MRNQKFTVTSAELNSLADVVLDVNLVVNKSTPTGQLYTYDLKAMEIYIPNNSGTTVLFNLFEDDIEYNDYLANPSQYEFLPIKDGNALGNHTAPETKKMVVRGEAATATADLDIYFINYQQRD